MFKGINAWDDLQDGRNPALMRQSEETGLTMVMNFRIQCHWFSAKSYPTNWQGCGPVAESPGRPPELRPLPPAGRRVGLGGLRVELQVQVTWLSGELDLVFKFQAHAGHVIRVMMGQFSYSKAVPQTDRLKSCAAAARTVTSYYTR